MSALNGITSVIEGVAAPLPLVNCDTDTVIPKQFLTGVRRKGLASGLFHDLRFDPEGREVPGFVLNREPYRAATVLVCDENFGCGSSREHAPWALEDFGIRALIAPSFADIFRNNCIKNGLLPVVLPAQEAAQVLECVSEPDRARVIVDLQRQTVTLATGQVIPFEIDSFSKARLLAGLDEIGASLAFDDAITRFEMRRRIEAPWLDQVGLRL